MYWILRLITKEARETDTAGEERRLRDAVGSAPGVILVADILRHPKSGYLVSLDHEGQTAEILEFLDAAGYSPVL
jgi:hypothetical protein